MNTEILESVKTLTTSGKSSKEIAEELNISERSVRNYRAEVKTQKPVKSYMHPKNEIDFNLVNGVVEILVGNPGINKYWLIRAYTSNPVASAVFVTSTNTLNLGNQLPEGTKHFEILKIDKRMWDNDTNS